MQPVSGYQYSKISGTAAGTTTVSDHRGYLKRVVIGSNQAGTVTFYDDSAAPSTEIIAVNNNAGSIPTSIDFDARFKDGLIAVKTGATDMLVIYQ